jgi:hypothetical protein
MKHVFLLFLLITCSSFLFSQDEYSKPAPKNQEPISTKNDSIELSPKNEVASDLSKGYKGISEFRRNIRIGGGFNLGSQYEPVLDNQAFFIALSPQITYVLSEYFEGGFSTSYSYYGTFDRLSSHSISAGPILRAYPFEQIFLQIEGVGFYNTLSLDSRKLNLFNVNAFVGGGLISRLSETSYILTGIKVNLMKNELTNFQTIPTPFTSVHFGLW